MGQLNGLIGELIQFEGAKISSRLAPTWAAKEWEQPRGESNKISGKH